MSELWREWWVWAVGGLVLGIVEVVLPGYIFLGFAVGAVAVGLLLLIGGAFGLSFATIAPLLLLFALASLIGWYVVRRTFGPREGQVKIWEKDVNDN